MRTAALVPAVAVLMAVGCTRSNPERVFPAGIRFAPRQTVLSIAGPINLHQEWRRVGLADEYRVSATVLETGRVVWSGRTSTPSATVPLYPQAETTYVDIAVEALDRHGRLLAKGVQRLALIVQSSGGVR